MDSLVVSAPLKNAQCTRQTRLLSLENAAFRASTDLSVIFALYAPEEVYRTMARVIYAVDLDIVVKQYWQIDETSDTLRLSGTNR
ncbi:hypothetical protein Golomagni_04615 [Golovinomyces magnicellulatus]|nr:hypothetical protein Golomagni_04615 [Golovinomyces magnicellulatus]